MFSRLSTVLGHHKHHSQPQCEMEVVSALPSSGRTATVGISDWSAQSLPAVFATLVIVVLLDVWSYDVRLRVAVQEFHKIRPILNL